MSLKRHGLAALALLAIQSNELHAEDSDRFRPYLHWRSGEFNTAWGVLDMWGFGLGANFNRHWGAELVTDAFERELPYGSVGTLGEEQAITLVPQLRVRWPVSNDRLVLFAVAGAGAAFLDFNDPRSPSFGKRVEAGGTKAVVTAGGGLEYFLTDSVTFTLEGKYLWMDPLDWKLEGRPHQLDMSSFIFTFGLRAYFTENRPQPLAESAPRVPTRLYVGVRAGASVLTDKNWGAGVTVEPESAVGPFGQDYGLAIGANFGTHWGLELVGDYWETALRTRGRGIVGEYSLYSLIPHARVRWPIKEGRFVPYCLAGVGITYAEFNDAKPAGQDMRVEAKGIYPAVSVGAGMEYFIHRNFSLNAETKWTHSWGHRLRLDNGPEIRGDLSAVQLQLGFRLYLR